MKASESELQVRMVTLSGDALRAIVDDSGGEYSDAARHAASAEIARRSVAPDSDQTVAAHQDQPHEVSFVVEDAAFSLYWRPFRSFERWCDTLLPHHVPERIKDVFWMALSSILPAALVLGAPIFYVPAVNSIFAIENSVDEKFFLVVGTLGLFVAYGIWSNRRYARFLAAVMVAALAAHAVWSNWRHFTFSTADVATLTAAFGTAKYLLHRRAVGAAER